MRAGQQLNGNNSSWLWLAIDRSRSRLMPHDAIALVVCTAVQHMQLCVDRAEHEATMRMPTAACAQGKRHRGSRVRAAVGGICNCAVRRLRRERGHDARPPQRARGERHRGTGSAALTTGRGSRS